MSEFILAVKKVYTLQDLKRMDFVTYFKVMKEAEEQEKELIAQMETKD